MKIKNIFIILAILILAGIVYAVGDTILTSPTSGDTSTRNIIEFVCNGSAQLGYNITSIDLYIKNATVWDIAKTSTITNPANNSAKGANWTIRELTFGQTILWNCRVNYTKCNESTTVSSTYAALNSSITIPYLGTLTLTSPADNYYPNNSTVDFTYNCSAELGYNVTNTIFYSNHSGTWTTYSYYNPDPKNNSAFGNNTKITDISDGTAFSWKFACNYSNNGDKTKKFSLTESANRTVYVEYPPEITLLSPSNNGWVNSKGQTMVWNVSSNYAKKSASFYCLLYDNFTSWTFETPTMTCVNATRCNRSLNFPTDGTWKWGIYCSEYLNSYAYRFSSNNTVKVDSTFPSVTLNTPNNTYFNTRSPNINYSLTETNNQSCQLWINQSVNLSVDNTLTLNRTLQTYSHTYANYSNITLYSDIDGTFVYYISCNDSAANWKNSSFQNLIIDTDYPAALTLLTNYSRSGYCDQWTLNITSDEAVNVSVDWGTDASKGKTSNGSSTKANASQYVNLINQSENTLYYLNVTVCDLAANCNESADYTYRFPFKLCTGWTYFGIYERQINMSNIIVQSGADYTYWWNYTDQSWIYSTSGAGNGALNLRYGDTIALYEGTNSTWAQNRTGTGYYNYNISAGSNFMAITTVYTFGSFLNSLMNISDSWGLTRQTGTTAQGHKINFTYMSAYNNSARDWTVDYLYLSPAINWTINNATLINKSSGIEVIWVYSEFNISSAYYNATWNGSSIVNLSGRGEWG